MSSEGDSFDDPRMAELLRRFGRDVSEAGEPLFEAPDDLLATVEHESPPPPGPLAAGSRSRRSLAPWFAAAAALLIVIGIWSLLAADRTIPPAPELAALILTDEPTPVRDASRSSFTDGESIYLYFRSDRAGEAALLRIDAQLTVTAPLGRARRIEVGDNTLGPVVLDGASGLEAFVILAGGKGLSTTVESLITSLRSFDESDVDGRLRSVLSAITEIEGVSAIDVAFEHLPP